jgi:hypothetical protein
MFNRRSLIAASFALPMATVASALAQSQAITGIATSTTYSIDGRITAVDPAARTVTLTYPNGSTGTYKVAAAVANFANTKVGDVVTAALDEKRTFVLSGPNTKVPGDMSMSTTAAVATSTAAAGASSSKVIANWWVTSVDPAAGKISLVDPGGGQVRTYSVTDQAARTDLSRVKPGDSLTSINSETVAVSITPKR